MKRVGLKTAFGAVVFALGSSQAVHAQTDWAALSSCVEIAKNKDRLSCFDGVMSRYNAAQAGEGVSPEVMLSIADSYGREDLPEVKAKQKKQHKEKAAKNLAAKAVTITENARGKYVVTLDNGQVWRQINADTGNLRVPRNVEGAGVTIKRAALGGYSLKLDGSNRTIKVERRK